MLFLTKKSKEPLFTPVILGHMHLVNSRLI